MRLPRDISGEDLVRLLSKLGYVPTRQAGSHVRLTTKIGGEHHVTIPRHDHLRLGTVSGIVADVAIHFKTDRQETVDRIFGK